jgi:hypothetical protein
MGAFAWSKTRTGPHAVPPGPAALLPAAFVGDGVELLSFHGAFGITAADDVSRRGEDRHVETAEISAGFVERSAQIRQALKRHENA